MKMNISTFPLIFIILIMKIVQCDLASSPLVKNVFLDEDSGLDLFRDPYMQSIFRMDKNTLMKIPILDDDTFLKQLNEGVIGKKSLILRSNPTSIDDDKLDEELLSQRAIEETWDEVVVAGPIIINYIGSLIALSSAQDFALALPNPNYDYQYIKYPNSFRTTLVQIANEMYNAFLRAHSSMDRIQLDMQQIPKDIKTVLQLLTSASNRLIQSMLPITLDNIERIIKQCADVANSTSNTFLSVTSLLQEVTEVTINTYGYNTQMSKNISNIVENSKVTQALLTSELEEIRKKYEEARLILEKSRDEYYNAYHAIPTRRKRFFGGIGEAFGDFVGGFVGGVIGGVGSALQCIFSSCNSQSHPPLDNRPFQNAKERAELALNNLKDAEAKYDEWYTKMLEQQNNLAATTIQLSQLHTDQIDYNKTIDILISATKQLGEIGKQWSNMTKFFTALALRAEVTRETVLHKFIDTIKSVTLIDGKLDDADREFFVLNMLDVADDIDSGSHLLYIMAKTYYDVSSQYMINQISGLAALAVIQTQSEREARMQQLAQDTLSTSAKVSRMALDRKQQYKLRNQARQNQYISFIQQTSSKE